MPAAASRPDFCVILVDSMRADHLGCYGYERDMSPTVDVFAVRHAAATVAGKVSAGQIAAATGTRPYRAEAG